MKSALRILGGNCMLAVLAAMALAHPVNAQQKYPEKNVVVISPVTAGAVDVLLRGIAEGVAKRSGTTLVIQPRPGAFGSIAAGAVASAEPDGYTIGIVAPGPVVVNPLVNKDIKYDQKSFAPIALLVRGGSVLVGSPKLPASNFAELLKLAKSRAEPLRVGYNGLAIKIALLGIEDAANVKFLQVPFGTPAGMQAAAISGDLDLMIESPGSPYALVQEGRLKAIAAGGKTREPLYPKVGTIAEVLPGQGITFWLGMVAPAATPKDRLAWLEREIRASLEEPLIKARMYTAGFNVVAGSSKAFADEIRASSEQLTKVVKKYGITEN